MKSTSRAVRILPVACFLAAACGGESPPPAAPESPASTQPAASSVAPPLVELADAGAPVAVASTPEKSPFHVIALADAPLDLLPLGDALFVRGGNIPLARVEGDRIQEDERYGKGLEGYIGMRGLFGHFPDDAWATIVLTNGRVGWGGIRKWNGQSWAVQGADLSERWIYAGISPWVGGSLLALVFNGMPYDTKEPVRFRVIAKGMGAKLPVPTKTSCGTLVKSSAFAALPTGEVFAVGSTCDDGKLAAEWWAAGETKGRVERFNAASPDAEALVVARSPTDVWILASTWEKAATLHFDGSHFALVGNSFETPAVSAALAADGTLWLVSAHTWGDKPVGTLYKRKPQGDWQRVPLPEGVELPRTIHIDDKGVMWLTAGKALLRSTPPQGAPQKVTWASDQQFPASVNIPKAATAGCQRIYVLMYGITKVTPKDYDFPLTRQALKGHTELGAARFAETEDNGKRYFGAFVPDLAMGKKIERLIKDKVKGSKPAVLCTSPKVLREIRIDLATGDVVK